MRALRAVRRLNGRFAGLLRDEVTLEAAGAGNRDPWGQIAQGLCLPPTTAGRSGVGKQLLGGSGNLW
jgi:hypothetical protein